MREWTQRGIKPVRGKQWYRTVWVDIMTSPRLAGLREWQGEKYPAQWPAILDVDTHERLAKMFADPARRKHIVRSQAHLLSGIADTGESCILAIVIEENHVAGMVGKPRG